MQPYELDRMILSAFRKDYWQKTAAVIGRVQRECENQKLPISEAEIYERILDLVDSGVLQSAGNLAEWRYSEVRPVIAEAGIREFDHWIGRLRVALIRQKISVGEAIDRLQARMPNESAENQLALAFPLGALLMEEKRYEEALRLFDRMIPQAPDDVTFPIWKAICLKNPEEALDAIEVALERAYRTNRSRREALGEKARILVALRRGQELGEVLEQIMSLPAERELGPDIEKERDFVDSAPPGLIPQDIMARYNEFCPKSVDEGASSEPPDHRRQIFEWVQQLKREFPIEDVIDRVRSRLQNEDREEKEGLELELEMLLTEAERYDEALRLIDSIIERKPDDVRYPISKATLYYYNLDDREEALKWIDFALERAFRTRFFRREALGTKARLLVDLGRGEELGQVLEQIMSLDMYREVPDIGKERDFVDRAPPGLIPQDIVARYDKFFPKDDRALELHRWADKAKSGVPIAEAIERVRSRMQGASAEDQPTLAYFLAVFLTDAGRHDEALPLFESVIEQQPDNVLAATAKATLHLTNFDDPAKALEAIALALERAFRTRFYRRHALGVKARILLKLSRGEELGQVLEQIMSLQMFFDARDRGRERDFVDQAPPGLIPEDIVARYNAFCPKVGKDE
jgi:tetratricopeptide (TPR) repeat protein